MEASGRWLNDFISMLLGKLKIEFIMLLGNKIRSLRDEQGILQRQVAAYLEIDTPMFSKIERGDRRAKRSQVTKLAEYFHLDEKELLTLWLADRILDALEGEDELQLHAIDVAKCELTKYPFFLQQKSPQPIRFLISCGLSPYIISLITSLCKSEELC